ncbi:MAG: type II CRISPR RNA-guided endonuclease Cas9 [Staphylococcus sp.]|nr:type II CRISPR RNA-guided endonuclease Cas9 [Staphylococcus sp.]
MRLVFGLDAGVASTGWAAILESVDFTEPAKILGAGARTYNISTSIINDFSLGKSCSVNTGRRINRGMRRRLQRFILRRKNLIQIFKNAGWLDSNSSLIEAGSRCTHTSYALRAKAASEEISLKELALVLLMLNKKRGYRSSRKISNPEEGQSFDAIDLAKTLKSRGLTPGQYSLELYESGQKKMPQYYKSDLQEEFDKILATQMKFHPSLPADIQAQLAGKNESKTWAILASHLNLQGLKRASARDNAKKIEECQWRVKGLDSQLDGEQLGVVLSKLNGAISSSSGLLSDMSERSKELVMSGETIGQYKWRILSDNPHHSFRNQAFFRKDYEDEFETIWETQSKFHPELTPELKKEIKEHTIFYQRPLKSQKSKVSVCQLASKMVDVTINGHTSRRLVGSKVAPLSSPVFQQFRMWQRLNDMRIDGTPLTQEQKLLLAENLEYSEKMTDKEILSMLYPKSKGHSLNFKEINGNHTMSLFLEAAEKIFEMSGHSLDVLKGLNGLQRAKAVSEVLKMSGINPDILFFDADLKGNEFEMQPAYHLWHLLYSAEDDDSRTGTYKLEKSLCRIFGFDEMTVRPFISIVFDSDYADLSAKAMRRLLPHMRDGMQYSDAAAAAGYNHSAYNAGISTDHLDQLEKNSLRNPVVEKILNQIINVVNTLIQRFGRPDEIRIEMARELKKSSKERQKMSEHIATRTKDNKRITDILAGAPFFISKPSQTDIVRYRLYEELASNGYKTLYSSTFVKKERLFSNDFNIEHIIPQATLFDDSYSNKTLETREANLAKGNKTAIDYVEETDGANGVAQYTARVNDLLKTGKISKAKARNLLCRREDIPTDFLNRDLTNTQYIARKATEILSQVTDRVTTTNGAVTARLREDWGLVDIMKELNWDKYNRAGMTSSRTTRDGKVIGTIEGWSKRNDNRHHAMDALTIVFTRPAYIQYLNNLAARSDRNGAIYGIEKKYLARDANGNLRFIPPMPYGQFRAEAKKCLEGILISTKAKNTVVTTSRNRTRCAEGTKTTRCLAPRVQLHNDTIYGRSLRYVTSEVKIDGKMDAATIARVASKSVREALKRRLDEFDGNPKKAFTGKNSLAKNPIYLDPIQLSKVPEKVKLVDKEPVYTSRTPISPSLKIDKVIDKGIQRILEARLAEFEGNAKDAFSNLDANPIYLNEEKGITIKRVAIRGPLNVVALRSAHDHFGNPITDSEGNPVPTDYVQTSGNHHVALFLNTQGKMEETIISYFEATARAISGLPIIDRNYGSEKGWKFFMTLKRNEYLVFPRYETSADGIPVKTFDPNEIDLLDPANYTLISPNLFRVQKLATKNYVFRHHLETTVDEPKELRDVTWKRIQSIDLMKEAVKVRIDSTGRIVQVGEY